MISDRGRNRWGFTLIEIMVVVAVIGVLTLVVSTNVAATRKRVSKKAVMIQLHNIAKAEGAYYGYEGKFLKVYGLPAWKQLGFRKNLSSENNKFTHIFYVLACDNPLQGPHFHVTAKPKSSSGVRYDYHSTYDQIYDPDDPKVLSHGNCAVLALLMTYWDG